MLLKSSNCFLDRGAFVVYSSSMCRQWKDLRKANASRILALYCFNGGERTPNGSLTEWVSSRRVASSPGGAVHVFSFSPALPFASSDPSEVRGPSSFPNSVCSLLASLSSRWSAEPSADDNKPSERSIRDARVMFNRRPCNFKDGHKLFLSQHYPPSSPKASSLTAHPPRQLIGQRQNNQHADWTRGIFLFRDVSYFLGSH